MPKDKNETIEITQGIVLPPSEDGETDQALIDNFLSHSDEEYTQMGKEIEEAERKKEKEDSNKNTTNNCVKEKKIKKGHCAYNDSPLWLKTFGENVVEYEIGDDFIPNSNHCHSKERINIIKNSSEQDLLKLYIKERGNGGSERIQSLKTDGYSQDYITCSIIEYLLSRITNILKMYNKGERFKVVKATYMDKEPRDGKRISCRYVDIESQTTGEIYRTLSE